MKPVSSKTSSEVIVVDVKDLPSKGLPYSVKTIELRCLTLGELKYLSSSGLSEESLVEVYKKAIHNIDVNELSWTDFLFLSTHISLFTIDSQKWTITEICQNRECGELFKNTINRETFFEFDDLNIPDYPINVVIKGKELSFGIITVKSHMEYGEKIKDIEPHLQSVYSMAGMVLNMDTNEAFEFLKEINDPTDIELLQVIDEKLYHGVKPLKLKCTECGIESSYSVDLEVSTITPFRENQRFITDRINFGKRFK